jgi:hypothetical protein
VKKFLAIATSALFLMAGAAWADPPKQGSGKNASGKKVEVFAGNPHDRPGANAK